MIRTIVQGALGHMGREVVRLVDESDRFVLAAGVDRSDGDRPDLSFVETPADVLIDFSHHSVTGDLLAWAASRNLPVVIGTTGHTDEELSVIEAASRQIPVFKSANMSLGVALLADLVRRAAAAFPEADVEIVEIHHNRKLDAPSGTALLLADAVREARPGELSYGRHGHGARQPGEIGIHSLRMGNVVGTHEVTVNTGTQSITLRHEAFDRALFAEGALSAAGFLIGRPAGLYGMNDLINQTKGERDTI